MPTRIIALLAALPPTVLGLTILLVICGVPPVSDAFWPPADTNPAETAVLNDVGRLRLLGSLGADLRLAYPVRRGLLPSVDCELTPHEAATLMGHEDAFVVLWELAPVTSPREVARLWCVARTAGADRIEELLAAAHTELAQPAATQRPWPDETSCVG